jgi:uncharacterized membrane protein YgcG
MLMFAHIFHPLRLACAAAAIAAALPAAASAAVSTRTVTRTEQMLAAAGFQAVPANTAERQADMAALPAGRVIAQPHGDGFTYVLADPTGCACLYMGDAGDYQAYQRLLLGRNAGQYYDPYAYNSLNWNLWGPFDGWGWGSNFLHGGLGGHGGGFGGRGGGFGHGGGVAGGGRSGGLGGPGQHAGSGRH